MSERAARYDAYGYPIAPLTDATVERREQDPINQAALTELHRVLRELWAVKLRRGWFGVVTLEFSIRDGIIDQDMSIIDKLSRRLRE